MHTPPDAADTAAPRFQLCSGCGLALAPRRLACPGCGSPQLHDQVATGLGVVHAVTVVHRAPTAAFAALVPYTLVLVTLDEGPRLMGHGAPGLTIGQRVRAAALVVAGQPLLRFEPAPPA